MHVKRLGRIVQSASCALIYMYATATHGQTTNFTDYNKTISRIGAQGTIFYVGFNEPLAQTCQYGNIYIAQDRKGMYAQLLAAKLTGRRISRVDYSQPSGNGTTCSLELVEFIE